jgi:YD repeat-containing protein
MRSRAFDRAMRRPISSSKFSGEAAADVPVTTNPLTSVRAQTVLSSADGPWGALGYTYDAVGNRSLRSLTPSGGSASVDSYAYAVDSNRLTAIANPLLGTRIYSSCASGNTAQELRALPILDDWDYGYNDLGRMVTVSLNGSTQADYLYNALGQQVSRTVWSGGSPAVTLSVHDLAAKRTNLPFDRSRLNAALGPKPTLPGQRDAAVQLSHCCHSCVAQHFHKRNDGSADGAVIRPKRSDDWS